MRKLFAVLAVAGLVGCGESGTALLGSGPLAMCEGTYTPAAYPAQADTAAGDFLKLHAGAGISAVWPDDSSLTNTYMLDFTAQVDIAFGLTVEVSLGWKTYDYDYDDGVFIDQGELTIKPLYATLLYCKGEGSAKIYTGGGLQWDIADIESISGATMDNSVGYHAVLGVSLTQSRFSLQVEGCYSFTDYTIDTGMLPPIVELGDTELLARVKFLMNF